MGQCMTEIQNKNDYIQLKEKYPQLATMFGYEGCEACKGLKPKVESMCSSSGLGLNSPVAVAYCDVKKTPFCMELYRSSQPKNFPKEDYGVPLITGVSQKDNPASPNFFSIGAGKEEEEKIRTFFNAMGNQIKKMNENGHQTQTNSQPQKRSPSLYNPSVSNKIMQIINTVGGNNKNIYNMQASESGSNNLFCMPGVDCDYDTFRKKVLNFSLN